MLPTLENSERFKTEFNDWRSRINNVTNDRVKTELNEKLNQLLREVRAVDQQHRDILMAKQLPNMIADSRTTLTDLRQSITRQLEDYEKIKAN
jgi:hypothetical protein